MKKEKRDTIFGIFMIILSVLVYCWSIQYERNTDKILKQMDTLETKVERIDENVKYNDYRLTYEVPDMLVVPEKPKDYWEGQKFQINWYIEETKEEVSVNIEDIISYIKDKEKFRESPYRDGCLVNVKPCPKNKIRYSNGYGTQAKSKTEKITKVEADKRLRNHITKTILPALKNVKFETKEQMFASIDFSYNIGHNAFKRNIVKNNKVDCAKMTEYTIFNGKENNGLKQRRFENFIQCVTISEK